MSKLRIILVSILLISNIAFGQKTEIVKGIFEYNQILETFVGTGQEKEEFINILNKMDIKKIERYLELVSNDKYDEAEKVIQNDSILSIQDTRIISALYSCYFIFKNDLLDYNVISLENMRDYTVNVFLTKNQLEKIRPVLGKEMKLKTQYITEVKYVNFRIYKLLN
jgi:hypothetical protein